MIFSFLIRPHNLLDWIWIWIAHRFWSIWLSVLTALLLIVLLMDCCCHNKKRKNAMRLLARRYKQALTDCFMKYGLIPAPANQRMLFVLYSIVLLFVSGLSFAVLSFPVQFDFFLRILHTLQNNIRPIKKSGQGDSIPLLC